MTEPEAIVTYQVPGPGAAWTEEERSQLSLVVTEADGSPVPLQRSKVVRRRVDVLEATNIVTRARLTYLEHRVVERRAVIERVRPSPIAGKRYVLEATGGAVTVRGDDGGAVSPEEDAAVHAEDKRFGQPETLAMLVARLRYRVGEPVAVPAAEAARLFPGDLEVAALELTWIERDDAGAHFALRLGMRGQHAGIETRADVVGTLRVDPATAQLLEMKLVGPVHLTGALVADGTLELLAQRTPT